VKRDVRRRLEEAGRAPIPGPDGEFAEGLEARLMAVAASGSPSPEPSSPRRQRRLSITLLAAGIAAVVLAVVLVTGAMHPTNGPGPTAPELIAPVDIEVQLADGTTIENPDGLLLPDGAVVTVGHDGSGRIGDLVLRPGDVVTVVHGRPQVRENGSVAVVPTQWQGGLGPTTPSRTPLPSLRPSPAPPTATPAPSPSHPAGSAGPTPATPTSVPTSTPAPTATPGRPTPTPTPTASPGQPSPTPVPAPRFTARAVGAHVIAVAWKRTAGATRYVLVITRSRTGEAARPAFPGSPVLGQFARAHPTPLRFRLPVGVVQVKLMVVALDKDGHVLWRSRVVRIALGG